MPVSLHRPVLFFLNMTKPVIWVVYSQITERYSRRPLILHQYLNSLTIDCDQTCATHSLSHSRQPLPGQIRQSVTKLSGSRADDDIKILIRYKTNVQKKNPVHIRTRPWGFFIDCMCVWHVFQGSYGPFFGFCQLDRSIVNRHRTHRDMLRSGLEPSSIPLRTGAVPGLRQNICCPVTQKRQKRFGFFAWRATILTIH